MSGGGRSPSETTRIFDALRRVVQVLRESALAVEQGAGISSAQLFALQNLSQTVPMSVNELAQKTFTHQSSVSVVVRRLVARGLVKRTPSSQDARRVQLTLSPAGQELLKRAPRIPQTRILAGIDKLTPAQRRRLALSLEDLLVAMGAADAAATMLFEDPPRRRTRRGRRNASA